MKLEKILGTLFGIALLAFLTFLILHQSFPKASPRLEIVSETSTNKNKESIRYAALGDSLTEGVGDATNRGGFVSLVSNSLQEEFSLTSVEVENYGVAGERSDQILKRLEEGNEIQNNMQKADIITLTVGGNDLMKVIRSNLFGLSVESFKKPLKKYQKNLTEILTDIQDLNPKAPIYVLGVYNPFYVNFPEITDMETIVDNWNDGTKEVIDQMEHIYFVPINEVISRGLGQPAIVASEEETTSSNEESNDLNIVKNNLLYDKDKFHPNTIGYQLMANEVKTTIARTQKEWLPKENE
ncbi:SGNH/GDSL hydrolase family protein [Enterococcus olivae]